MEKTAAPVAQRIGVVIPNWNGERYLDDCLAALRRQTASGVEVIVVDNGSTDGSVELIRSRFPEVKVVELGENRGFAAAMNAGIRTCTGAYVAFLNNDTEADPAWLEELAACLERHPQAAAATSKMLLFTDRKMLDGAGDVLGRGFLPHPRGNDMPDRGQYDDEVQVFSASGGAALWRREALEQLGGFDERFFAYYEDVDLGYRSRCLGYECWYAPRAVVLHHSSGTLGKKSDFSLFHFVRNRWFLILKNTPATIILTNLPHILFGDVYFWLVALKRRRLGLVLRGYAGVVRNLAYVRAERRSMRRRRKISNRELRRLLRMS